MKTRENFDETRTKAEELKAKYMDSKMVKFKFKIDFISLSVF